VSRTTLARGLSPAREVLDNGAVAIVQETGATPAVTIDATFQAGSLHEPADLGGLAYLTAKVLDRGTMDRSAAAIAEALDDRGVGLTVSAARHTMSLTATCLAEDFDELLALVGDIARRPLFPEGELDKRRAEVLSRLRQDEDNPAVRAVNALLELLYGSEHPYGRPLKGTADTVERTTRDDLRAFHARYVRPAALRLAIVGDVATGHALRRVAEAFGDWEAADRTLAVVPPPPAASGRRERFIGMPGKVQADIAYGFTTISRLDPRYYAYWMMNTILGQFGLGGRLADNIRERQGMAYYAFSSFDPMPGEAALLVRAGVDPADVPRAVAAIDNEVRNLGECGPTEAEVEETRQFLIGSVPRMFETNQSIASFLQTAEQFGLGLDHDRRLPELFAAVTREDVAAAAAEVLRPDLAALAVAGPAEAAR
jgi:zinc protease